MTDRTTSGAFVLALHLEVGRGRVVQAVELPFPGEKGQAIECAFAPVGKRFAAGGVTWSS
jgi:hypothetical protein